MMIEEKTGKSWIRVGGELPALEEVAVFVRRNHCGAVNIFEGVTRNHDTGRKVTGLYYDSYPEMAFKEIVRILDKIVEEFSAGAIVVIHKTGEVPVGQVSMIVAVSTAHRQEAADATLAIIRQIKEDVPIWKKEFLEDDKQGSWK